MFLADFTPQEVCVFLKLCTDHSPASTLPPLRPAVHVTTEVYTPTPESM